MRVLHELLVVGRLRLVSSRLLISSELEPNMKYLRPLFDSPLPRFNATLALGSGAEGRTDGNDGVLFNKDGLNVAEYSSSCRWI